LNVPLEMAHEASKNAGKVREFMRKKLKVK
jgi:hypothetical protein